MAENFQYNRAGGLTRSEITPKNMVDWPANLIAKARKGENAKHGRSKASTQNSNELNITHLAFPVRNTELARIRLPGKRTFLGGIVSCLCLMPAIYW
jgi:hypothetical protein